jgi:hypothetical protein
MMKSKNEPPLIAALVSVIAVTLLSAQGDFPRETPLSLRANSEFTASGPTDPDEALDECCADQFGLYEIHLPVTPLPTPTSPPRFGPAVFPVHPIGDLLGKRSDEEMVLSAEFISQLHRFSMNVDPGAPFAPGNPLLNSIYRAGDVGLRYSILPNVLEAGVHYRGDWSDPEFISELQSQFQKLGYDVRVYVLNDRRKRFFLGVQSDQFNPTHLPTQFRIGGGIYFR